MGAMILRGGEGGIGNGLGVALIGMIIDTNRQAGCVGKCLGLVPKASLHVNHIVDLPVGHSGEAASLLVITGTDGKCYREKLAKTWGVEPIEIASGTEATFLAAESWKHNGMVFFPDSCFYEFIDEEEMRRNLADPGYTPRTCLMNEVVPNRSYELVISVFHGGAFMRYRIGDMYRCIAAGSKTEPPRFTFVDRIPSVIDIAGFTRITESSIREVIRLSKLGIGQWLAKKEFKENGHPFLHMYVEVLPEAQQSDAITVQILTELLAAYFKYFDSDYSDLKKLLDMEPLEITILRHGTIDGYKAATGRYVPSINPDRQDVTDILRWQHYHR